MSGTSAFVGRQSELEELLAVGSRAAVGGVATALVVGEAGIGKTRVASEVAAILTADGWWCPVSHGVSLAGGEVPFGGTAELVRALVRGVGEPEVHRLLGRAVDDLAPLVPSLVDSDPHPIDRGAVTAAVLGLLDRVGRPVCWLLDDLQWMDGATHDLVSYLARVATGSPLLLLGTVRTDPATPDRLPDHLVELGRAGRVLVLAPLTREHVAAQARALAGRALGDAEVERICAASDGLPFFVEELVTYGGRVSGSLQGVLHASLGRLSPDARTLRDAAAVGDGLLTSSALRVVSGLGKGFDEALAEVRSRGILLADPETGGLRFRHALLIEAVEAELLAEERLRLHRAWAEHLERALEDDAGDLTMLIERARHRYEVGGPEAFEAVHAAALATEAADDDPVRCRWWARTIELWPTPADDAAVLARDRALAAYVSALWAVGDLDVVVELMDTELSGEVDWLRDMWFRLMRRFALRARQEVFDPVIPPQDAEATLARVLAAPRDLRSTEVLARLADDWADDLPDLALSVMEEARSRLDTGPSRDVVLVVFDRMAFLLLRRGEPERGVELLREYVAWSAEHDPGGVVGARCSLSFGLANSARYSEAIRVGEDNLPAIRGPELHPHLWVAEHILLAFCALHTGDWERAEQCLELAQQGAIGGDIASAHEFAAAGLWLRRGDLERARMHRDRIPEPEVRGAGDAARPMESVIRAFLAVELAAAEQDAAATCAAYRDFERMCRQDDFADDVLEAYVFALRGAVVRGTTDAEVGGLLAEAPILLRRDRGSRALPVLHAEIAGHVARAADDDSAAGWRGVAAGWTSVERPLDAAYCQVVEAECLLRDGERDQARTTLAEARATADRLGAGPLRHRCDELAARSRLDVGVAAAPPGALTSREAEVLGLVALGRTNGEIGAALFISTKTVSVHVSRILAKLGAANRTEAAALARRQGLVPADGS